MLEPQDFRDVLVIARERSLKHAARVLAVDPSTMGRRLDGIEQRFGARLFLRTAQGFDLTPEGNDVMRAAEKMEDVRLAFERELVAKDPTRASLTVTSAEWGIPVLTPVLLALGRRHPDVQLRLRVDNRALDLARREADLALRVGRPIEASLTGKRVGIATYGLYGATSYLARRPPRALADLAQHPFVSLDETFAQAPHVRWQQQVAGDARVVLRTNSMLALVEAVRAGAGLGTLPTVIADRHTDVRRVLPELASIERDLWLVFHRDLQRSRTLRAIVDDLVAAIRPLFTP